MICHLNEFVSILLGVNFTNEHVVSLPILGALVR